MSSATQTIIANAQTRVSEIEKLYEKLLKRVEDLEAKLKARS